MEGCDIDRVLALESASSEEIRQAIRLDERLVISLLNLLHNIVVVQSLHSSKSQQDFFDRNAETVRTLLLKKTALSRKKELLCRNIPLVRNIAASCPATY